MIVRPIRNLLKTASLATLLGLEEADLLSHAFCMHRSHSIMDKGTSQETWLYLLAMEPWASQITSIHYLPHL